MTEEEQLLKATQKAVEGKKWKRVEKLAKKILLFNVHSPKAYSFLGLAAFYKKDFQQAKQFFTQANELLQEPDSLFRLGFTSLYLGAEKDALICFQKAIDCDPKYSPAYFGIAFCLQRQGDFEKAIRYLERAHQLQPFPQLPMDPPEEISPSFHLHDFVQALTKREKDFREKKKLHHFDLKKMQAKKLRENERYEEALALLNPLLKIIPEDPELLEEIGLSSFFLRRFRSSTQEFRKAVQQEPTPDRWYYLGSSLYKEKKLEEALQAFQKAVSLSPQHAAAHYSLGVVLEKLGRAKEAYTAMERALLLNPHQKTLIVPSKKKIGGEASFGKTGCISALFSLSLTFLYRSLCSLLTSLPSHGKGKLSAKILTRLNVALKKRERD